MKQIKLSLDSKFNLKDVINANLYELENDTAEVIVKAEVEPFAVYEIHFQRENGEKFFRTLNKGEGHLSLMLDNSVLAMQGKIDIQIVKHLDGAVIISNKESINVGNFINATEEPTPVEKSVIQQLLEQSEKLLEQSQELKRKAEELEGLELTQREDGVDIEFAGTIYRVNDGKDGASVEEIEEVFEPKFEEIHSDILDIGSEVDSKADADVVQLLGTKVDTLDAETLQLMQDMLKKANSSDVYDKEAMTSLLNQKASVGELSAVNTLLTQKINEKASSSDVDNKTSYSAIAERLYNNDTKLTDEQKLKIETWLGLAETYLTMYNATPYQVDGDYVPAHKKYVDSEIAKHGGTGGLTDIRIKGGDSLVVDGVGEIPITSANKPGLVKIGASGNSGLFVAADGTTQIDPANDSLIDSRANSSRPINPSHLPYRVKSVMSAPVSATDPAWTEAEQASARQRMGVGDYELLNDITVSETTNIISITADKDGNPYLLDEFFIVYLFNDAVSNKWLLNHIYLNNSVRTLSSPAFGDTNNFRFFRAITTTNNSFAYTQLRKNRGISECYISDASTNIEYANAGQYYRPLQSVLIDGAKINKINIQREVNFSVGTRILVYGK